MSSLSLSPSYSGITEYDIQPNGAIPLYSNISSVFFQGVDGLSGDKGDDGEAGQPVSSLSSS